MIEGVEIRLIGTPEKVQRAADALDTAFPGIVLWCDTADQGRDDTIRLDGFGADSMVRAREPVDAL